jgi:hypothetical protein
MVCVLEKDLLEVVKDIDLTLFDWFNLFGRL